MNQQPLRIVVARSEQARAAVINAMSEGNKAKTAAAPAVVILAADTDFNEEFPQTFPHSPGAKAIFDGKAELRESSARFNAGLQVAYFIIGVRAVGLAAGPMTGFDAAAVDQEFFPDGVHKTLAVMNIGKPAEDAWLGRLPRLDYDEVVRSV
jgi:3-hydroxypropanoate dehydrogenase